MDNYAAIGIDIGTQNSVVATVKKGGIEILLNESSNRLSP
jgi:molecular chaperone DnaK (HSP70)